MLGAIKFKCNGLVNGNSYGFGRGVAIVPDMNRNGFSLQASTCVSITNMPRGNFQSLTGVLASAACNGD